ncbi:TetR/AcrR family transcriptional regulator [Leptospira semungkisensis]|uniref:TetR/AcrR family transcriptional regulator n=1 Tax=Leptospira semungkisensis TaxID=2484985 RepID=A0A4R9FMF5_9LEPT|nr:TetR/AcrR family transcriptional regulator [Leptospira semungkisensis]TGJ99552.1 TetR/AcrR family transcriptional regulator [Leptospira semungkisensis]
MQETSLRETIVTVAGDLFVDRGYNAVSIKQIADAANCTTAALYYYYEDGKGAILKGVLRSLLPEPELVFQECANATSLKELFSCITIKVCAHESANVKKDRWLLAEFPNFGESDRHVIYEKLQAVHSAICTQVSRFLEDPEAVRIISWIFMCTSFGYGQLFGTLQLGKVVPFSIANFAEEISDLLSNSVEIDNRFV